MTLLEKIDGDLRSAMKAGDASKVSTLRMLKASVGSVAIQKGKPMLEDADIMEIIRKTLKQHQESVDAFTKGGRADLAQKETHEAQILKGYLPPSLSEQELKAVIQATIQELGVSGRGPSAMGQVMKAVLPKLQGRADGKQVSQMVGQLLQGAA